MGIIIRVLLNMLALWLATALIPGITTADNAALIWAAIALGLVNAFIRPLVVFLTLPVTLLTLGLFLLFVNAAMLYLAAWFVDGFEVVGVIDAVFGAVIVSLVSWVGAAFIGDNGRYRVLVIERRR
jgi:putative membrane protein